MIFGLFCWFFISIASIPLDDQSIVNLDYGSFKGKKYGNIIRFLGVPFAQPPIGNLRFSPPQLPITFDGIKDAKNYGPGCIQKWRITSGLFSKTSEDCLTINIWTSDSAFQQDPPNKLPVMVWIYGGGFKSGVSSSPFFDGHSMLSSSGNSIIFVSFNYRVGAFGFLASEELVQKNATNLGLLDQVAALEWVKKYIGQFGGDSNRITVAGESAGAISIGVHLLANDGTQNLFHQAILESGAAEHAFHTVPDKQDEFNSLVSALGCKGSFDVIECLSLVPAQTLLEASEEMELSIVMDGLYLKRQPTHSIIVGNFSRIPLIIGTNTDEGTLFTVNSIKSAEDLKEYYQIMLPFASESQRKKVSDMYPIENYDAPYLAAGEFFGDYIFQCPSLLLARAYSRHNIPVYKYRWNHEFTLARHVLQNGNSSLGVFHFSEVPFVFNVGWMQTSAEEAKLGKIVNNMWAQFVINGNPNLIQNEYDNIVIWPDYGKANEQVIFQTPVQEITIEEDANRYERCKTYDLLGKDNIFKHRLMGEKDGN